MYIYVITQNLPITIPVKLIHVKKLSLCRHILVMVYSLLINWLVIILSSTETAAEVVECYNRTDNGAGYLGKITLPDCITWKEANSPSTNYYEDHKYCRNPLPEQISKPYCYVGPNFLFKLCGGIKECNVDCSMGLSSSLPPCEVLVTCQPPPSTADYHLSPNRTLFYVGEKVYFQCVKNGFMPSSNYSTCHENGTFDHVECKGIICPFPLITNMEPQNRSEFYRFPESVNITCQTGYELIGLSIIHCTETGSWTQLPTCTGIICPFPLITNMEPQNRSEFYRFPKSVNITCQTGYELIGLSIIHCTETGSWTQLPTCTGIICPFPLITNMEPQNRSEFYRFPESVNITCQTGYELIGLSIIHCTETGSWTQLPTCTGIICPFPLITNMEPQNRSEFYRFPKSVNITCQTGYELIGLSIIHCTETGSWTQLPTCTGIICPFPLITNMEPQNRSEFYRFPESVNITCQTGYELIGLSIIHCTETGSWTQYPTCTGVQCENLYYDSTMEMSIRRSEYRYPDVVDFSCKTNYELVGAKVLQCQANGRWNERQPMCFENNGVSMATFASVVTVLTIINVIAVVVIAKLLYVRRNKEQKPEQAYEDLKVNNSSRSRPENTDDTYTELR